MPSYISSRGFLSAYSNSTTSVGGKYNLYDDQLTSGIRGGNTVTSDYNESTFYGKGGKFGKRERYLDVLRGTGATLCFPIKLDYFLVGGGGGGGSVGAGGGGGVVSNNFNVPSGAPITFNIVVGKGGNGSILNTPSGSGMNIISHSVNGGDTIIIPDTSPNPNTYIDGSLIFGAGKYLVTQATSNFQFTGNFTIEAWIKLSVTSAGPYSIFSQRDPGSSWFEFRYYQNNFEISTNAGSGTIVPGTTNSITPNTWYHVAGVRSGSVFTVFVNGQIIGSLTGVTGTLGFASNQAGIGADQNGTNQFIGSMATIRITNTAVYTSAFTPVRTPLTANSSTKLLLNVSNNYSYFNDSSPSALTINMIGSADRSGTYERYLSSSSSTPSSSTSYPFAVAAGGGGGGSYTPVNGIWGGYSGGSGGAAPAAGGGQGRTAGFGFPGQGFSGGINNPSDSTGSGGGGGGAGGVGFPGISSLGGNGGIGIISDFDGVSTPYAGGGGGIGGANAATTGKGGLGGGGDSSNTSSSLANGLDGTGGGGGAVSGLGGDVNGSYGGSGVAMVRFPQSLYSVTPTYTGSPTITTVGIYTVYKFTSNGSITFY